MYFLVDEVAATEPFVVVPEMWCLNYLCHIFVEFGVFVK